jgi:predicted RNA-binding Zn-ribbon protein involved in translation (DUF1610 family)
MSIDLTSLREQDVPFQCPCCFEILQDKDIIGETEYDVMRIGHNIGGQAVVFDCPHCFEKSFLHKESLKWKIR